MEIHEKVRLSLTAVSVGPEDRAYTRGMGERTPADYFDRRAEEERTAAANAADERAARSHRELADHYRNIANGSEQLPADHADPSEGGILRDEFRIVA